VHDVEHLGELEQVAEVSTKFGGLATLPNAIQVPPIFSE
jgi:hypothetical protein